MNHWGLNLKIARLNDYIWPSTKWYLQWTVNVVIALIGVSDAEFSPIHLYMAPLSLGSTRNTNGWKWEFQNNSYKMKISFHLPSSLVTVLPLTEICVPSFNSLSALNHLGVQIGLPPLHVQVKRCTVSYCNAFCSS